MIIGFSGPMGSGKTTAANFVQNGIVMSFASPLKNVVKTLFGFTDHQLYTLEGKEAIDEGWEATPRNVLQWLGTDCLRHRWPDFWVRLMKKRVDKYPETDLIVIDDVRFDDEAEFIRESGGVVVHLRNRSAVSEHSSHESEKGVKVEMVDFIICNNGTLKDLKYTVAEMLGVITSGR